MAEKTIHFDNAREAQEISGRRSETLAQIERELGVRLTARDIWIRVEGEADRVSLAERFFENLRKARDAGASLRAHSVIFALKAFDLLKSRRLDKWPSG